MKTRILLMMMLLPLLLAGCIKTTIQTTVKKPVTQEPKFPEDILNFSTSASFKEISLKGQTYSSVNIADNGQGWCEAVIKDGKLQIKLKENTKKEKRIASITLANGDKREYIFVRQLGTDNVILVNPAILSAKTEESTYGILVTANVEYEIDTKNTPWVTITPAGKYDEITDKHILKISANPYESKRTLDIKIKGKDGIKVFDATIYLTQAGFSNYKPHKIEDSKPDLQIKVKSGHASSFQPNGTSNIERSFDGDKTTNYHSKWDKNIPNYFPITLTYNFEEKSDIDYFIYYPVQGNAGNGLFKEVDIMVKQRGGANAGQFVKALTYDFKATTSATTVDIPVNLRENIESIRFIVKSGNNGFAACSEMEFYKKNPENFDPLTVFTDRSCSELKPGISESDINNIKSAFFKNMALTMKNGKYPSEFRIRKFKAYPDPGRVSGPNKIWPYNIYDNVTGIYAAPKEELIVLADNLQGRQVSIMIRELYRPGGDGFKPEYHTLHDGLNRIKVGDKGGLVYIAYHTDDYKQAPVINIHFANGTVNGYFDIDRHRPDEWTRLINNAKAKYFDIVGKYSHLTFTTNSFMGLTKNAAELIEKYDRLVKAEWELLGLYKYNRVNINRMHFQVVYKGFMYASPNYTAYNENTLSSLCTPESIISGSWGPAHECGHCNQTAGFKWRGTTEVTTNVFSLYVQTVTFQKQSRALNENKYESSLNNLVLKGESHATHGDVFNKLIPFWQLQLYFGNVLGRTPEKQSDKGGFYPDVFEHLRVNPTLNTPGDQQTEFVYICSKVAKMDLTDFFTAWGFLKPVDAIIDDYGKEQVKVTPERAQAIRTRVANLGYAKPDVALEYITDNNKDYFKTKAAVVAGTATRKDKTLTMKDWKNVVIYEVRDAADKLIYVSEGITQMGKTVATFTIPQNWDDNYKVYAISATRQRTLVNFN